MLENPLKSFDWKLDKEFFFFPESSVVLKNGLEDESFSSNVAKILIVQVRVNGYSSILSIVAVS